MAHGLVGIASDNTTVVAAINKKSVRGLMIQPLRIILLIAATFDINIKAHWIPTRETSFADAVSRHDFKKPCDLGLKDQVTLRRNRPSSGLKASTLRQSLKDFYTRSLPDPFDSSLQNHALPLRARQPPHCFLHLHLDLSATMLTWRLARRDMQRSPCGSAAARSAERLIHVHTNYNDWSARLVGGLNSVKLYTNSPRQTILEKLALASISSLSS